MSLRKSSPPITAGKSSQKSVDKHPTSQENKKQKLYPNGQLLLALTACVDLHHTQDDLAFGPEVFQAIEIPLLGRKQVDNDIAVVQHDPTQA